MINRSTVRANAVATDAGDITIAGSDRMLVYDDTEPAERVKIYEHGVDWREPIEAEPVDLDDEEAPAAVRDGLRRAERSRPFRHACTG